MPLVGHIVRHGNVSSIQKSLYCDKADNRVLLYASAIYVTMLFNVT